MDIVSSASGSTIEEPEWIRHQPDNVIRLLLERHHIRAKVENPSVSIALTASARVDHDRPVDYSTEIGNPDHLDLLNVEAELREAARNKAIPKADIIRGLAFIDAMSEEQAAVYMHAKGSSRIRYRKRVNGRSTEQAPVGEPDTMGSAGALRPIPHVNGTVPGEVPSQNDQRHHDQDR